MPCWLLGGGCLLAAFASLAMRGERPSCTLPGWPDVSTVARWPLHGAREQCFCAYAHAGAPPTPATPPPRGGEARAASAPLDAGCPSWREWVSTDGEHADRISHFGASATVLGARRGNASASRYAFVGDWAVDLGSGFGAECDRARSPRCEAVGAHVLSLPRARYLRDCCGERRSLGQLLRTAPAEACALMRGLVEGGLRRVPSLDAHDSCRREGQEPTAASGCLAQCFHIVPDVYFLHLHTTVGALAIRADAEDSGLGPAYNASERADARTAFGRYNLCVCEPREWADGSGRGSCPEAAPADPEYALEATVSLCRNLAGVMGIEPGVCMECARASAEPVGGGAAESWVQNHA
ncbi:hypothetical protein AB1Y20_015763 [Prymnesium parvum]|uniref:Uncharacterized protein n=1 Tax=Prymnesium parvum TaxID=97485 RepID=A0AB34K2E4_PRYPA